MKVGSIVECVKPPVRSLSIIERAMGVKQVMVGEVLTIREIVMSDEHVCLLFEEVVNPKIHYCSGVGELVHRACRFRELLPPEEIAEALEEVREHLEELELV